ncbi:MAG: (Fe-S)-binding protein, partial [Verrucomicrobia bacterium]|nr:(Fe-S)-binding protein [Verrucomicrobiota bacterium]
MSELTIKKPVWAGLEYATLQQCMHCGLCLSVCPTYVETKRERHSPRGRIATARAIADGKIPMTREFAKEVYFCLGCLACTSACPAGVDYATIFEHLRAEAERSKLLDNPIRKVIRYSTIYCLFMDLRKLLALGWLMRLYERLGIQWLIRLSV